MYAPCDPAEVLRVGSAQYNQLHQYYDQEIAGFRELQDQGVIIINRAYLENRWSFWWAAKNSGTKFTDAQFKQLWIERDNYYRSKGINSLIRIYSQGFNAGDGSGRDTYAGDSALDLQGEDLYSDTLAPFQAWYDNELKQHPTKPWCMAEWGSGDPATGNPNYDMRTLLNGIKSSMPATVLVQAWCGTWRLAAMKGLVEAMNDPLVLVRENMNRPT